MLTSFNRAIAVVVGMVVTILVIAVLGGLAFIRDTRDAARRNEHLLTITLAVAGCFPDDTPEECRGRQAERARVEGVARIAEVDCRTRLALSGAPALPPNERCAP